MSRGIDSVVDVMSKARRLSQACELLASDQALAEAYLRQYCASDQSESARVQRSKYEGMLTPGRTIRKYSDVQRTRLFLRDRFRDRYSNERLVYPGVLRLLSHLFPDTFPYHPNWKYEACHSWFWELYPTVDHVDSAGADTESNWVTTSMMCNLKKANVPLDATGWKVQPITQDQSWDGLLSWFLTFVESQAGLSEVSPLRKWQRCGRAALS